MNYNTAPDSVTTDGNIWRKVEIEPWRLWFAWRPVKTKTGERVWLRKIYRRCVWHYGGDNGQWAKSEYADMFDVIGQ